MKNLFSLKSFRNTMAGAVALGAVALPFNFASASNEADTLVIARSMDLNALDPARSFCDTCQIYLTSVYDTLVSLDKDNKTVVPRLAASWDVNDNQTEFTFKLDERAVFADGTPVEVKDVIWSFNRVRNIKGSPSFFMDGVVSMEETGARSLVIKLDAPDSEFINRLSAGFMAVVNSDLASANGASADANADSTDQSENWFLGNSAGSGPFKLVSYRPDEELRLARNEAYWANKPHFSEVVFRQSTDAVAQSQLLESGGADIAMQIDFDTADSLRSPEVVTEIVPSYNFLYVGLGAGAKTAPVKMTPEVREAIALAIDYDGVIDFTVAGQGAKQSSPIPNGFPGSEGLPERHRDLDKARELLAKAGHADGFTMEAVYPNDNVYGVDINMMMQKIQQDLADIKIKIELKPATYPVWRAQLNGDGIPLTAVYYAADYYGSSQYLNSFGMMPGTVWAGRAGAEKAPDIYNAKETELFVKAKAAAGAEQEALYHQLGLEMMKDNIVLPLVSPNLVMAYRADIEGVRYSACCNLPLAELSRKK